MKKTATLIMLDKPILVNEERIKVGDILYVDDIFHSVEDEKDFDSTLEYPKVIAGHEGTKRLTFNLSEQDTKKIGYVDVFIESLKIIKKSKINFTSKEEVINFGFNILDGIEYILSLIGIKKYKEDDMIEFSEWCNENFYGSYLIDIEEKVWFPKNTWDKIFELKHFTTKELFEIFLKQRQPKQFKVEYTETETEIIVTKIL